MNYLSNGTSRKQGEINANMCLNSARRGFTYRHEEQDGCCCYWSIWLRKEITHFVASSDLVKSIIVDISAGNALLRRRNEHICGYKSAVSRLCLLY